MSVLCSNGEKEIEKRRELGKAYEVDIVGNLLRYHDGDALVT
jgi:hypothetical protein